MVGCCCWLVSLVDDSLLAKLVAVMGVPPPLLLLFETILIINYYNSELSLLNGTISEGVHHVLGRLGARLLIMALLLLALSDGCAVEDTS